MSEPDAAAAPGLARRLASFVYEGILLFAVAMVTGLVYSPLVQQHHALEHRGGLMLALALSFSAYFLYFWTRSGQTLPMKTWHIRVVRVDGSALSWGAAVLRLLLSLAWWVLPIVAALQMRRHEIGFGAISVVVLLSLLGYALLALVLPGRQFLHDVIGRTRLVTRLPVKRR